MLGLKGSCYSTVDILDKQTDHFQKSFRYILLLLYLYTCQFYGNRDAIFVFFLVYEQIFVFIFQVGSRNFQYFI